MIFVETSKEFEIFNKADIKKTCSFSRQPQGTSKLTQKENQRIKKKKMLKNIMRKINN